MDIGPSEAETFWIGFPSALRMLGSGDHQLDAAQAALPELAHRSSARVAAPEGGLEVAVAKLLHASCQRCRVHFARNALAYDLQFCRYCRNRARRGDSRPSEMI